MKNVSIVAAALTVLSAGSAAHAYGFEIHNETPNTVWTAIATHKKFYVFCQESDCGEKWRVKGWWQIAPGGMALVDGEDFHKKAHDWYAEDAVGHVWSGATVYCSPWAAFNYCMPRTCTGTDRMLGYRNKNLTTCCGAFCPGDYGYVFLVL